MGEFYHSSIHLFSLLFLTPSPKPEFFIFVSYILHFFKTLLYLCILTFHDYSQKPNFSAFPDSRSSNWQPCHTLIGGALCFFVFFLLCFAFFVFWHFLLDFMIAPGQATASRPQSLIGEALWIPWFFFFSFYIFCIFAFFLHFMITLGRAASSQATLSNWRGQSLDTHVATIHSSSFCQSKALTYHISRCNFVSPYPSPHIANQKLWPTYHFAKQKLWPPTYQDVILSPFLLPSAADPAS